jgi:hypothetical protein
VRTPSRFCNMPRRCWSSSVMSAVSKWLEAISLGQYADAFEANDVDMDLLSQVDDQTLKDIGVMSAGHRLRGAAAKQTNPSVLLRHLLDVAQIYNSYYMAAPVIVNGVANPARLLITQAVHLALKSDLAICGNAGPARRQSAPRPTDVIPRRSTFALRWNGRFVSLRDHASAAGRFIDGGLGRTNSDAPATCQTRKSLAPSMGS